MTTALHLCVTCPDAGTAREIADALVGARLAACCHIGPAIESRYRWEGKVERASEVPLTVMTAEHLFQEVADRIVELHPYETPAIIAKPVLADEATLRWIEEACIGRP